MNDERRKLIRRARAAGIIRPEGWSTPRLRDELSKPERYGSLLARDTTELDNQPRPVIEDRTAVNTRSTTERILWVQAGLRAAGYHVELLGDWNDQTIAAVRAFQQDRSLEPSGVFGWVEATELADVLVAPVPQFAGDGD